MDKLSAVLVNLQNPREKVWGILLSIHQSGVTVLGIDLNSFEDWMRSVAAGEREMGLSTVFLPIHRVERVSQDERVGSVKSMAEVFEERVGTDVWAHLGLKRGLPAGRAAAGAGTRADWMSLADAEVDYIERVLEDCGSDRSTAAGILGITVEELEEKLAR